jgi:PhnB protein
VSANLTVGTASPGSRPDFKEQVMLVNPIPAGRHTATPYLIVKGAAQAIEFYKKGLQASEVFRMADDAGKIGHAEIQIGTSAIMLADEYPEMGYTGPESLGGTPVSILLYVEDVDTRFAQAVSAGATVVRPLADQFYGDRTGTVRDPFGHVWTIATHIKDLTSEELAKECAKKSK